MAHKVQVRTFIIDHYTGQFSPDVKVPIALKPGDRVSIHRAPDAREHDEFLKALAAVPLVCRWVSDQGNFHLYRLIRCR